MKKKRVYKYYLKAFLTKILLNVRDFEYLQKNSLRMFVKNMTYSLGISTKRNIPIIRKSCEMLNLYNS